jgi:hypothetical protein
MDKVTRKKLRPEIRPGKIRRFEMDHLQNSRNLDDSDELTSSADKQLEDRLAEAAETPSALKPALGSSPSDGNTQP